MIWISENAKGLPECINKVDNSSKEFIIKCIDRDNEHRPTARILLSDEYFKDMYETELTSELNIKKIKRNLKPKFNLPLKSLSEDNTKKSNSKRKKKSSTKTSSTPSPKTSSTSSPSGEVLTPRQLSYNSSDFVKNGKSVSEKRILLRDSNI
jgi:serine/threonine protein kinase